MVLHDLVPAAFLGAIQSVIGPRDDPFNGTVGDSNDRQTDAYGHVDRPVAIHHRTLGDMSHQPFRHRLSVFWRDAGEEDGELLPAQTSQQIAPPGPAAEQA